MNKLKCAVFGLLGMFMIIAAARCGYHLTGSGSQIPKTIHSVFIKPWQNKSPDFLAEQKINQEFHKEFIRLSKLKEASDTTGDSVVEAEIANFSITPVSIDQNSGPGQYRVYITIRVKFINLTSKRIIYENKNFSYMETVRMDTQGLFFQKTETSDRFIRQCVRKLIVGILENY